MTLSQKDLISGPTKRPPTPARSDTGRVVVARAAHVAGTTGRPRRASGGKASVA
jgi:hypothetical protein